MTPIVRKYSLAAVLVAQFVSDVRAADTSTFPAAEAIPLVTVVIERSDKEAPREFTIKVTVTNTLNAPITLNGLTAIVPSALHRPTDTNQSWRTVNFENPNLPAGQKVIRRIFVPSVSPISWPMISFVSSTLDVGATFTYSTENVTQPARNIDMMVGEKWEGGILAKLFGGVVGCSALALFLSVRQLTGTSFSRESRSAFIGSFVSTMILGIATVLAATLLITFLAPGDLPITFSIEDWRGGALLGLFSIPIGKWLLDKVSPKETSPNANGKTEKTNGTANAVT